MEVGIGLKLHALRQFSVIEHLIIAIQQINITVIVNGHAAQFLNNEVEINVHADNADKFSVDEKRRNVRNDIVFRHRVNIRLNPRRAFAFERNIIPADIFPIDGRIRRKIYRFTLNERRQGSFPTNIFAPH